MKSLFLIYDNAIKRWFCLALEHSCKLRKADRPENMRVYLCFFGNHQYSFGNNYPFWSRSPFFRISSISASLIFVHLIWFQWYFIYQLEVFKHQESGHLKALLLEVVVCFIFGVSLILFPSREISFQTVFLENGDCWCRLFGSEERWNFSNRWVFSRPPFLGQLMRP